MRWLSRSAPLIVALLVGGASAAGAQPRAPLRLRSGTIVPPRNVGEPGAASSVAAPLARRAAPGRRHLLLQFSRPIGQRDIEALASLGAMALRYVPDHALLLSVPPVFDPSRVPDAHWTGELRPIDRLSQDTAADLSSGRPAHPLTAIEFHPDVAATQVEQALALAGTAAVPAPGLPPHIALVASDAIAIERLAALDVVAWIYPAPADLLGPGAPLCDGIVQPEGVVASFAAAGEGWDGAGLGAATLGYRFSTFSTDLPPAVQRAEVERAMSEWSRHAAIGWRPAASDSSPGSVQILWGPVFHGDGFPFPPGVLAHAFHPAPLAPEPIAGDVHFNDTFAWGAASPGRIDVFSIALHELGHSLGLPHSSDPRDVMYPFHRGVVDGLAAGDISGIRRLYAAAPPSMPGGWETEAIGPGAGGTAMAHDGGVTITARGRDIWDAADDFRFAWRRLTGDGDIVARIDSLDGTHRWSKAGVMIRADASEGAPHAFMLVSTGRGLAFQRRRVRGGSSVSTAAAPGAAPRWVWLARRGSTFRAYEAVDGGEWRFVGADTIAMGSTVLAGLAVTNHDPSGEARAEFSNVDVAPLAPREWTAADIGAVGVAGFTAITGAAIEVRAAGADIWNEADAFRFVWQPLDGDGEVVARVASLTVTKAWSKAGVMIRETLEPSSAHAFMLVSAGKGLAFQRRVEPGGASTHTAAGTGKAPGWVKLERRGHIFSAFRSSDGRTWTLAGRETIPMGRRVLAGLAVSSHDAARLCRATFEGVAITRTVQ